MACYIVCNTGSNEKNVLNRYNKGVGAISQMDSMLNRMSLGHYYFEIGLVMRDTMLVSKLVYNSEVWYNVSDDQISKLEQIDEMWMRKLFSLAKSAPKEGIYIESGKMPIRFIVMIRRLMYFWHVLHRNENELVNRFLSAQQIWTGRNDWISQVRKNMAEINLKLTDKQITDMKNEEFKKQVKTKVELFAIRYLKKLQSKHSKTSDLVFESFTPAKYLVSPYLSKDLVQLLYKLRNYMVDVKQNFGSLYRENMWCRTCFLFVESQRHLLQCSAIIEKIRKIVDIRNVHYEMLFDEAKQVEITRIFSLILKTRKQIIDETRNPPRN